MPQGKAKRRLIVYCDESDDKGRFYSHFYGGAAVDERKIDRINRSLDTIRHELAMQGEVKWTKIGAGHVDRYCALMDAFFDHVKNNEIKVRIMFMQNIFRPEDLEEYQIHNQYFLLYYQFVKHAFGFQFCNPERDADTHIVLHLDELPSERDRCEMMKDYLASLSNFPKFRESRIIVPRSDIAEINSKDHIVAQCLDVVLGAMQFRLNDKHKEKPPGARIRGKRTIAKEKVYKHINARIRDIYPRFNVGTNTGRPAPQDVWKHQYRHWNFKPAQAQAKPELGKRRR